ncbi:hypothetical protein Q5P01_005934 [Channa striata]|uniref:Protein Shroom2 n=1 Tax=Channa striata TaxID=64152 RepID=A0AA88SZY8_CHASR|nr:hypothetical protein Q5P01_005934 [Channa striata]
MMRWWRQEKEDEELVEVRLQGKAPWGFTLRGGSEHREPLLITKVEQGSAAAAVRLQPGDEMVSVNSVPLSGSRQEAICLVKRAHRSLTLVVRRKNDPGSRPHSWHSSKLTEEPEPIGRDTVPATVWKPQHEARSKESSTAGDQDSQAQLKNPFSSVNNMERLEQPAHHHPPGRLSPPRYISGSEPFSGPGGKRDSGFSCFSGSSSSALREPIMSARKGTSSENIFFKELHSEGPQQAERPRYLQPTLGNGGWEGSRTQEQPASHVSVAGRPSIGPVWQLPEKKSQSPPPPPPPLRSDSFAATKVFPYSEGSSGPTKNQRLKDNDQSGLRSQHEKTSDARRSFNPLPTKDFVHPNTAADYNHNQLHPNKLFSLSSSDVRQSHYTQLPAHQRQYSDESPFYLQNRSAPPTKTQTVGSYYRSLQDLPTNAFSRKQVRHSTASMTGSAAKPVLESGGHSRYFSLASKHSLQSAELQARQGKAEGWRGEPEKSPWINGNQPGFQPSFLKTNMKAKQSLPRSQTPYSDGKERTGQTHVGNGLRYDRQISQLPVRCHSPEDAGKKDGLSTDTKRHFPAHQSSDQKVRPQDPWVPQEDQRISPLKTPLLHSLAQESRSLAERQPATTASETSDSVACSFGKTNRRSDRYATTLRKEIQQKRAQLQKSRSAATLTCEVDDEEAEDWRSTETLGVSFSNTYKDHLKEAQARVLQATSFQRRDLGPEASVVKTSTGRVRGRKRFTQAKKTHSFSEPDKINKVGVEGELQTGSFGERRKFFEAKPVFARPVPKMGQNTNSKTDLIETDKTKDKRTPVGEPEEPPPPTASSPVGSVQKQVLLDQQRLGTFAEYQATWNKQKKSSEAKTQGRYHSAENILDTDTEDKAICIHERSRSSPSADFYTQNLHSSWRDPQTQQSSNTSGANIEDRQGHQPDHSPQSTLSGPRNEGPVLKADSAGPEDLGQPPQTTGLLLPHLGPETTASTQEFPAGAQAGPAPLPPVSSSNVQQLAVALVRTLSASPVHSGTAGPDANTGAEEMKQEKAALFLPAADRTRSPSPQFAPQRLTDKPPAVAAQDETSFRSDWDTKQTEAMDVNGAGRKVPVRIVHADTSSHRVGQAYLPQDTEACSLFEPPPVLSTLGAAEHQASSLFSAYTRQDPGRGSVSSQAGAQRSEEDRQETTMDLMEGLFPPEEQILKGDHQRRRVSAGSRLPTSSPRSLDRREGDEDMSAAAAASLVPSSSYYNTSAPKAELLIKMKDMQEQLEEQDSEDELDVDLASKKQQLISSLARKLDILREARESLQEDVEDNEALGREVEATVQRLCRPNQLDKFRMFVGDLDKVVSLLLSLSGRLARVENALNSLEDEAPPEEKRTLMDKRKLLMRQHEDAKELKENLDRRERLVTGVMEAHLDAESLDDYRHFQRKLEDKIKLGEEQLKCLVDSLPLEQRPLLGAS